MTSSRMHMNMMVSVERSFGIELGRVKGGGGEGASEKMLITLQGLFIVASHCIGR